jgi:hypothetical protein
MNGIEAAATARVLESNLKDYFKDESIQEPEREEYELGHEAQFVRVPEQSGQLLNTIA